MQKKRRIEQGHVKRKKKNQTVMILKSCNAKQGNSCLAVSAVTQNGDITHLSILPRYEKCNQNIMFQLFDLFAISISLINLQRMTKREILMQAIRVPRRLSAM
jgi:hypothetical protein